MAELPIYYDPEEVLSDTESKRRNNCSSKATYASCELARAAAIQAEWSGGHKAAGLSVYRCKYCQKWHLSARVG